VTIRKPSTPHFILRSQPDVRASCSALVGVTEGEIAAVTARTDAVC